MPRASVGGTPLWDNPSATDGTIFVQDRTPPAIPEQRLTKRLLDSLGGLDLRVEILARNMVITATPAMQARLIQFAVAIINVLAELDRVKSTTHTRRAAEIKARKKNL